MAEHTKDFKECNCPRNSYNLSKSYFSQRTAVMTTNTLQVEKEVSKGCPQVLCCGAAFWIIYYNSLLNLKFRKQTEVIAFAGDLLIAVEPESIREAESITNI
jgi:hypothetical protein